MAFARRRFDRHEPVPIAGYQRFHNRMIGPVALQQNTTGSHRTTGTPGYLMEDLIGAFGRPQIATGKPDFRRNRLLGRSP